MACPLCMTCRTKVGVISHSRILCLRCGNHKRTFPLSEQSRTMTRDSNSSTCGPFGVSAKQPDCPSLGQPPVNVMAQSFVEIVSLGRKAEILFLAAARGKRMSALPMERRFTVCGVMVRRNSARAVSAEKPKYTTTAQSNWRRTRLQGYGRNLAAQ